MGAADDFLADVGKAPANQKASNQFAQDVAMPAAQPAVPQERPWYMQVVDAGNAFTHHVTNLPRGIDQGVTNLVGRAASLLPDNPVSRALIEAARTKNETVRKVEDQYQKRTPDTGGAYLGAAAGEIAPFLVGGGAGKLAQVGDYVGAKTAGILPQWASAAAPATAKTVSAATQGAIVGAASPVTNAGDKSITNLVTGEAQPEDYWDAKFKQIRNGALTGAAVPIVSKAVSATGKGMWNAVSPIVAPKSVVAPALKDWVTQNGSDDLANVLLQLRQAKQLVPDSVPTTAQVVANPTIVAAEKAATNNPAIKAAFDARNIANNAARIAQIENVAGSQTAIDAALNARKQATGPAIESILNAGKPVDTSGVLQQLESLQKSPLGLRPNVGGASSEMAALIKSRGTTDPTTGKLMMSPGDLDALRQNVKDYLAKHSTNGVVGSQQEAAFEPIRRAIIDSVEGANPGYRSYLETYAKKSVPINTMEAGGSILDNVAGGSRGANASGAPQVTLQRYGSALSSALKKAPYGIDPEAQRALEAVQSDLQRASISNSIKLPGSDTAYNLQTPSWLSKQLYGGNFTGTPTSARVIGGILGGAGGAASGGGPVGATTGALAGAAAMNKVAQIGQSRVNDVLAQALLDPQFAAELLSTQLAKQPGPTKAAAALLAKRLPQIGMVLPTQSPSATAQLAEALKQQQ